MAFRKLVELIRDGVWLKSYIAAVMRVEQVSPGAGHVLGSAQPLLRAHTAP